MPRRADEKFRADYVNTQGVVSDTLSTLFCRQRGNQCLRTINDLSQQPALIQCVLKSLAFPHQITPPIITINMPIRQLSPKVANSPNFVKFPYVYFMLLYALCLTGTLNLSNYNPIMPTDKYKTNKTIVAWTLSRPRNGSAGGSATNACRLRRQSMLVSAAAAGERWPRLRSERLVRQLTGLAVKTGCRAATAEIRWRHVSNFCPEHKHTIHSKPIARALEPITRASLRAYRQTTFAVGYPFFRAFICRWSIKLQTTQNIISGDQLYITNDVSLWSIMFPNSGPLVFASFITPRLITNQTLTECTSRVARKTVCTALNMRWWWDK